MEVWRVRLGSAFRTTLACVIVGCAAVYGPRSLLGQIPFPAFSYLTAILIVCDATLGDTLGAIWHAFCATVQVVPPSMLILWTVGAGRFSPGTAAVAAALSSFVVALPESTHILAKKIAFGQIVIVYVGVVIHSDNKRIFMHPIHIAASTTLGTLAAVLALLVPYPRLACYEVKKLCQVYAENASKRIGLFVKAFSSRAKSTVTDSLYQDKPFAETGAKLLQRLKLAEEGMMWERPKIKHLNPVDKLKDMEMPIIGMRIALSSCNSFPVSMINQEVSDVLLRLEILIHVKLKQAKCFLNFDAATAPAPEMEGQPLDYSLQSLKTISPTLEDLWAFFFLFCMKLLQDDSIINQETESLSLNNHKPNPEESLIISQEQDKYSFKRICSSGWIMRPRTETLVFASKCAIPLGLAVLFGLIFNKANGYWSGLIVAISFAQGRQATITVANARAQGTAMGSVYGVVFCFIFERFAKVRFLGLIPWFIFTSFLRHSRMYGQSGGMSAIIGALLILGRRNYGSPHEFAIVRLTEAFVGLFCLVMVELLLQPTRAASLAKRQLSQSLRALQECIEEIALRSGQKDMPASVLFPALREKQKQLKTHVNKLEKLRGEAELEPDFWFLPFRGTCYGKIIESLSKMADLLHFVAYRMEFLLQASQGCGVTWMELQEHFNSDLELFRSNVGSSLKCLEDIVLMKSLAVCENEMQDKNTCQDLELGKPLNSNLCYLSTDDKEAEKILSSFLQHSKELTDRIQDNRHEELKGQMVLCLSALAFCIGDLTRETKEIENGIKELTQWENPTSCINFHDISCRSTALHP